MANFYTDNEDLRWYVDKGIDWEAVVDMTEVSRHAKVADPEAPESTADAVELYTDVLNLVGEFAADEIAPHWHELDTVPLELVDGEVVFGERLQGIFDQIGAMGLHGLCVPRELGGMNAPLLTYMLSAELLARADVSVMTHHSFHGGMAMAMLFYSLTEGSTEFDPDTLQITKSRWAEAIAEIAEGTAWGCMDITEPDAGSDMAALKCRGEQLEDGSWIVSGQKIFVTSGHGKYHFVIARTEEGEADGMDGLDTMSLFLVPTYQDAPDGSRTRLAGIERIEEKLGHHASATVTINFDRTPAELVGSRGEGFKLMLLLMNNARIGVGFEAIGVAEAAYRAARDYAAQRPSMGKTIDRHEMIADYLDEMRTDIQGLRALAVRAAIEAERAQRLKLRQDLLAEPGSDEAQALEAERKALTWRARKVTPLLKYLGAEKAVEIARRGIQIHGGSGYTTEYPAEKLLRDAMVLPIYEGTSQIQSLMAMKDNLLAVMKDPTGFVKDQAKARWTARTSRDPLERRLAKLQGTKLAAMQHLMMRIGAGKFEVARGRPLGEWKAVFNDWDPKRDFAPAMLHAERLTRILADVAICEVLWSQAQAHPERRDVLSRYIERAEPRCRFMLDTIRTTGDRILDGLQGAAASDAEAHAAK